MVLLDFHLSKRYHTGCSLLHLLAFSDSLCHYLTQAVGYNCILFISSTIQQAIVCLYCNSFMHSSEDRLTTISVVYQAFFHLSSGAQMQDSIGYIHCSGTAGSWDIQMFNFMK